MKTGKRRTTSKREQAIARLKSAVEYLKESYPIDEATIPAPHTFGENVRGRREDIGLTQGEVGKQLGLSAESISCVEAGERKKVDIDLIYQLAIVLSCTTDYLFGRAGKPDHVLGKDGKEYKHAVPPATPLHGDFMKSCVLMLTRCPRLGEAVDKIVKTENVAIYDMVAKQLEAVIDFMDLSK